MAFSINTAITTKPWNLNLPVTNHTFGKQDYCPNKIYVKPLSCTEVLQHQVDCCVACSGKGWLQCDLCKGQKTHVKGENNRIFRRCPVCRAIGRVLCSKCKVYRCVTFPDTTDGMELSF